MGMDMRRMLAMARVVLLLAAVVLVHLGNGYGVSGNLVFKVENKFRINGGSKERTLSALKAHDAGRRRILSAVDIQMGGNALHFAKIGLGSPSKDYYVHVDTGSTTSWVNCAGCDNCPTKSDFGIDLKLYDPTKSETSEEVDCTDSYCMSTYGGEPPNYCTKGTRCPYGVVYGDGSSTSGYFVEDYVQLEEVIGNLQTNKLNASIKFGCGDNQTGNLVSSETAVDGILGFAQGDLSMISQLAAGGEVDKKKFAHCLDAEKGGGIFAIGDVVWPNVNTTPLLPNDIDERPLYSVNLKAIDVGDEDLNSPYAFDEGGYLGRTIIDSGTTLAILPSDIYKPLIAKIKAWQEKIQWHLHEQFLCSSFAKNDVEGFPNVTFHFDKSLTLTVTPHEYLIQNDFSCQQKDMRCIGWRTYGGKQSNDGKKQNIILGEMVLSRKLVVYDIENRNIGWTEYDCSSSIEIKDEETEGYSVGAHNIFNISNNCAHNTTVSLKFGRILTYLLQIWYYLLYMLKILRKLN